jgi:bifunctional DNA-binding transcriptional regulator/antitoxin component of YhaV-PrlF toxin-antitoxin module
MQRALDEPDMVAQNGAAIDLFELLRRSRVRNVPIIGRIVIPKLERRGLGIQANQAALLAFDDVEYLIGRAIETIRRVEELDEGRRAAGGTGSRGALYEFSSLREIR